MAKGLGNYLFALGEGNLILDATDPEGHGLARYIK